MSELRILFGPVHGGSYTVRFEGSSLKPVGVPVEFTPFLDEDDYEELLWYLEEYLVLPDGGAEIRAHAVEEKLKQWGRRLHDAVFAAPENAALLRELLAAPEPRELTIATDQSAILRLPWELMADTAGSVALRVAVRRQLEKPQSLIPRKVTLPLRMLYIISRPDDAGFLDPRLTTQALFDALDTLQPNVTLDFCRPPTLARMQEMLRDAQAAGDPYDLVHFDGHGTFLPGSEIGALCFEQPDDGSEKSTTDLVHADRLGDLLAQFKIPLVVLDACQSATLGKTAVFRSVAPRLIQAGVGSVLSMGHAVHVEAARLLMGRFYRELARGATIGHATAQARSALVIAQARWIESGPGGRTIKLEDWFLPHLYQRGLDEPLLPPNLAGQQSVRQYDLFLSHNHNDSVRVEALARALSNKHNLRVWLDKWECGPGKLEPQCEAGIRDSRFTVVVGSQAAINSKWVQWEIQKHLQFHPEGNRLLPVKFEVVNLPPKLDQFFWLDFTDPAKDAENAALLARHIRSADAEDARQRRGFRPPPESGVPGAFPREPRFKFQGRAKELYDLERRFCSQRGVVLHAMGGMGKTTLGTEAAKWWTRSGLFRDGACFISFERAITADRVIAVFGEYCEGPNFHQRPEAEQRRRAIEYFNQRAVLLVWDNYESALPAFNADKTAQATPYTGEERSRLAYLFRDFTTGPGKGRLLVTCRPGDTNLPGALKFELRGLARPDSLWLLHSILKSNSATLNDPRLAREKLNPLLDDLADHPLSIELVGPHLRTLTPEEIRRDFGKLVETMKQNADEERNTSLLASLEFSRRHLSPAARAALPWLGLFSGGVFEGVLLDVSQITPEAWALIRAELESIALLRVENDIQIGNRPFLRFHPTLAITSADAALATKPETRERFLDVYLALMQTLDKALRGSQSRAALAILDREEMNWRTAVRWAIADGENPIAAALGDTFKNFLERSGRQRERDAWVRMLRDAVAQGGFTAEAADYEQQHAWTLFTQGDPQGAVNKLQALIEQLRHTTEFDPAFQLATTTLMLGRVLYHTGVSTQAIPVLREAVGLWEQLVQRKSGQSWKALQATPDHVKAATELGNLSTTMGSLANALMSAGQHDEALAVAEKGLTIDERLGKQREAAAGHGQCARILMAAGRYDEADARYEQALAAARQAGDKTLEGGLLQHQGLLARERNQLDRATRLYQQALQIFQEAGNTGAMMRTYNLLGAVEDNAGRLAEARAWYEKSRELAVLLKDQPCLGQAAQNIGIVCQHEGEAARARGDETSARRLFGEARHFVDESLRIKQELKNKPDEAASLGQLAKIYLLLGDLDAAERHAHAAREIRESLHLKEAWKNYATLSQIATARGDTVQAAEWACKRDELIAELKRRAGGGGIPGQMLQALKQLTLACTQIGFGGETMTPDIEEALARLDKYPAPLPAFSAALRQLAVGQIPDVPSGLPKELTELLTGIIQAIRERG